MFAFSRDPTTRIIAAGAISIDIRYNYVIVDTEAAAATDDLDRITGATAAGQVLLLENLNAARVVTVRDAIDNIFTGGNRVLDNPQDKLFLVWDGSNWFELNYANNA